MHVLLAVAILLVCVDVPLRKLETTYSLAVDGLSAMTNAASCRERTNNLFYGSLIKDNPGEPVLSQRRDLLEQPMDFYEPAA